MVTADKIVSLATRRGFFWNAYEIYGGTAGFLAWGPLGTLMKRKIIDRWLETFVYSHGFLEIESPLIAPEPVFEASGHLESFKDPMVSCLSCSRRFKADNILKEKGVERAEILSLGEVDKKIEELGIHCPECGGRLGHAAYFTTMFQTTIGPYSDRLGYGRPETAQGMFTEFKRVYLQGGKRLPLGIAQVGRAFRNEISPRQGPIRLREFDMMELELFYDPEDPSCPYLSQALDVEIRIIPEEEILKGDYGGVVVTIREAMERRYITNEWMAYFISLSQRFLEELGVPGERQRFREKLPGEKAHYAEKTFDHEILLSTWGWIEVAGHADRTDYDLKAHISHSEADLTAERRLKEPRIETRTVIRPRIEEIKKAFGGDAGRVLSSLSRIDVEEVKAALEDQGFLEIDGFQLSRDFFQVEVVEEKIHVERFIPRVVEPSFGLDRICYAVLEYGYREREDRVILSLPAYIAPMDAAVFPIVARGEMVERASQLRDQISRAGYRVVFEVKDSIGRRYARADEIGVPVAFTIDGQTLEDGTATARDRDSWDQVRIGMDRCIDLLSALKSRGRFEEALADLSLGKD